MRAAARTDLTTKPEEQQRAVRTLVATKRLGFKNQFLQSAIALVLALAGGFLVWYALWPWGKARLETAAAAGGIAGVFCAIGSWLRSHDDTWEAVNLKLDPLWVRIGRRLRRPQKAAALATAAGAASKGAQGGAAVAAAGASEAAGVSEKDLNKAEGKLAKKRGRHRPGRKSKEIPGFEEFANLRGRSDPNGLAEEAATEGPATVREAE